MTMKLKLLSLAALATVAAVTTTQAKTTNILQNLSFTTTIYSQGKTTTSKAGIETTPIVVQTLNTKGLIKALSTDTAVTATPFSASAFLAVESTVGGAGGGGGGGIVVVDGSTITPVPTNVISYSSGAEVDGDVFNTKTDVQISSARVAIGTLTVNIPNGWSFVASGLGKSAQATIHIGKTVTVYLSDGTYNFAGSGIMGPSVGAAAIATPVIVDCTAVITYLKTVIK